MESEQPILDLTENKETEELLPSNSSNLELDFSAYRIDVGF